MKPLYSVIIISHNNFDQTTRGALESLSEDNKNSDLREVIVIDNGSNDETRNKLRSVASISPNPKFILEKSNLGFPKAVNMGIFKAYEWAIFGFIKQRYKGDARIDTQTRTST